jgi:poly-gamma-glutamate capsule biosynthesis protein CapA/YwtB (metallophosphatase superfamily)
MITDPIRILITGDFCPHNRIEELALKSDYQSVYNDFIDVFRGNDLNVTDLECPMTTLKNGRRKTGPHQKADPKCIELLKFADIKLAALANNHIMDYGSSGAENTIGLCNQKGIATVGAGNNTDLAREPFIIVIKEKRIAIINVADQEFLTATDGKFQANQLDPVNTCQDIVNARESSDFVIIIVHAGNEFYHLPSPRTKALYRFFIDAGADAIVSNHTHCFSGFEIYKEKPIFYGLGNFIYDWPGRVNTDWNKGYVVRLLFSDKVRFEIIPLKQGNNIPGAFHLSEKEKAEFQHILETRNQIIADDAKLEKAFQEYIEGVTPMYDAFIEPYFGRLFNAMRQRGLLPNILSRKKRLLLLNLTRCEAHREVLLRMLKKYE